MLSGFGIFIFLYIYLLGIALYSYTQEDDMKRKRFQTIASAFGLWLVLALRSPLCGIDLLGEGDDSINYYYVFSEVQNKSFVELLDGEFASGIGMERSWILYNKLVSAFFSSFQFFLALTALIQIVLISKVIYRLSSHVILSYMVFFSLGIYLACFSTLRQTFALSWTAFAFLFFIEKRYFPFIILVIFASFFHLSSLIFLLLLLLKKLKLTFRKGLIALGGLFVIMPFLAVILNFLSLYLFGGNKYSPETDGGGAVTMFFVYVALFLLSYCIKEESHIVNLLRIVIFMAVAGQSLGYISSGHLTRIAFYFSVFFMILLPYILDSIIHPQLRRVSIILCTLLLFAFFYLTSKDGYLNVVPYSFFWETNTPI